MEIRQPEEHAGEVQVRHWLPVNPNCGATLLREFLPPPPKKAPAKVEPLDAFGGVRRDLEVPAELAEAGVDRRAAVFL